MPPDPLKIVSLFADALTSGDGLRDASAKALQHIHGGLAASFVFLARPSQDTGVADIVASHGLHAADFRRLEQRLPKSGLWRILNVGTPFVVDELGQDPSLNFLAFACHSSMLVAVPVGQGVAVLAAGFPSEASVDENRTLRILSTIASVIANSLHVDQTVIAENEKLLAENRRLKGELRDRYDFGNLIGNSGGMRQALDRVRQVARSNAPVLLRGESGTGRDLFANAIRFNSLRSKRPFVKLDLAVLPASQAARDFDAALVSAEGGTLHVDEITAAPAEVQSGLRSCIRSIRAATRDRPPEHNVRFIVSTSRDIEALTPEGTFDAELSSELTSYTIFLPPLRERRSDILLLADHFLEKYAAAEGKDILRISTPAIDMLMAYHFPGNVRELENVIAHAVTVCDSNVIHGHHLPPTLQTAEVTGTETRVTLDAAVATFERDFIQDALKSTRGNVAKAARMLDSTERILGYKIKKYGLEPRRFKSWK